MRGYDNETDFGKRIARTVATILGVVIVLILLVSIGKVIEVVDASEIVVIQSVFTGELTWYTAPGPKWQMWGKVTNYPKRAIYEFACGEFEDVEVKRKDIKGNDVPIKIQQCKSADNRIEIRFNDGGHGKIEGSIQYDMPLDVKNLTDLHNKFNSPEAIQKQLVETTVNKSIYMTGPLMSSKESYADRRNDLIRYVEDQVERGVYQTTSREVKERDQLSGVEKTVRIVELTIGKDGMPLRQEIGQLTAFGIKPFNFSIKRLPYDETVEQQIQQQQQLTMQVQTSMAEAKQAEQRVITVSKQGEANAAAAKWEQEVIKAKQVTEAEMRRDVAKLDADSAEQYRIATLRRAEADATYKQRVMQADGALTPKLDALVKIHSFYADAIKNHPGPWVPSVVMGQQGGTGNAAFPLVDMLTAKLARDLGVDPGVSGAVNTKK